MVGYNSVFLVNSFHLVCIASSSGVQPVKKNMYLITNENVFPEMYCVIFFNLKYLNQVVTKAWWLGTPSHQLPPTAFSPAPGTAEVTAGTTPISLLQLLSISPTGHLLNHSGGRKVAPAAPLPISLLCNESPETAGSP